MTSRGRGRFLWSLLASVLLHIFTWVAVPWSAYLSSFRNAQTEDETLTVSLPSILIERRAVTQLQRRPNIARVPGPKPKLPILQAPQRLVSEPPRSASLLLPPEWGKQDYGNKAATDVKVWLDWTKQSAEFVPRVMLWQMQAPEAYMRQPSLEDAVQDVLASLHAQGAKVYASKAQRVCRGHRQGWFFSYLNPSGDPPVRVEETLFAAGDTIFRATYVRPVDQPEDTPAREALNTLC
jgi:hypothetical protein